MTTDKTAHQSKPQNKPMKAPIHVENSTDATRGEPLAVRAQKRQAELELALKKIPEGELRARNDIESALATVAGMLTGDLERLSDSTASDLNRWLETTKHLAEITPKQRAHKG